MSSRDTNRGSGSATEIGGASSVCTAIAIGIRLHGHRGPSQFAAVSRRFRRVALQSCGSWNRHAVSRRVGEGFQMPQEARQLAAKDREICSMKQCKAS